MNWSGIADDLCMMFERFISLNPNVPGSHVVRCHGAALLKIKGYY
jgi:hypothetical protein